MNRLFRFLCAIFAVAATTTACDMITESDDTGTVDLSYVDLALTIKLGEDQKLSAGYSTEALSNKYMLRVVVEARDVDNSAVVADRDVLYIDESTLSSTSSVTTNFEIAPTEHDILVWCDYVMTPADGEDYRSLAYEPSDLRGVVITSDTHAVESNSLRRAFAGKKTLDLSILEGSLSNTSTAEVSVVSVVGGYVLTTTSDVSTYASKLEYSTIPSSFNVSSGAVNATKKSVSYNYVPTTVDSKKIVGYDYILMDDDTRTSSDDSTVKTTDVTLSLYALDKNGVVQSPVSEDVTGIKSEVDAESPIVQAVTL